MLFMTGRFEPATKPAVINIQSVDVLVRLIQFDIFLSMCKHHNKRSTSCFIKPTYLPRLSNIMHFIKQRAAITTHQPESHLQLLIPHSQILLDLNLNLSYKGHYIKYPRTQPAAQAKPPSLRQSTPTTSTANSCLSAPAGSSTPTEIPTSAGAALLLIPRTFTRPQRPQPPTKAPPVIAITLFA